MKKMKSRSIIFAIVVLALLLAACGSTGSAAPVTPPPVVRIVELDNKGNALGITQTPEWITTYIMSGVSKVQEQYPGMYCIIGEETGVNKQFVLAWADNFSAQQRIGAMLRTNIATEYQARVQGNASSSGGANSAVEASGDYNQEIDNIINAVVNVSYSGAQRENDWWTLRRRYDPDQEGVYTDEFTAYVLYTFPMAELNRQIAYALETSVSADSALYDITIQMAQSLLAGGIADWIDADNAVNQPATSTAPRAPAASAPAVSAPAGSVGTVTIRNSSYNNGSVMTMLRIYQGFEALGEPYQVYSTSLLNDQDMSLELPEGPYTFEVLLNNNTDRGSTSTVGIVAGGYFDATFSDGSISSFSRR
jgi:hypothetical protein